MLCITRKKPTYDVGIQKDGKPLMLLPASKKDFEAIQEIGEKINTLSDAEKISEMYRLLRIILSNNEAGINITDEEVSGIDPLTAVEIIKEYGEFMKGLRNLPN